jgi:hypothetical protein
MDLENYTNINIYKKAFENKEVPSSRTSMVAQPGHTAYGPNKEHASQFNPYVNNQGTTLGKSLVNQIL